MSPCDLLLIEGYKHYPMPKLEVYRAANGKPLLHPEDPHIVAIATDVPLADAACRSSTSTTYDAIAASCLRTTASSDELETMNARPAVRRRGARNGCSRGARPVDRNRDGRHARRRPAACSRRRSDLDARRAAARQHLDGRLRRALRPTAPRARRGCASRSASRPARVGKPLAPGTAARIFTGAPIPPGADAVVMQEQTAGRRRARRRQARAAAGRVDPPRRRGHPRGRDDPRRGHAAARAGDRARRVGRARAAAGATAGCGRRSSRPATSW